MISFGRVVVVPRGEWQSNKEYKRCDIVTFKGKAYLAKQDSISAIPNQDLECWVEFSDGTRKEKAEIVKCKSCGAPLREGQTRCEWCRTPYVWN